MTLCWECLSDASTIGPAATARSGVKSLYADPAIKAAYQRYHDPVVAQQQNALARKKDIISPWFGEWNEVHAPGWQAAVLNKATPQSVLTRSADLWNKLRRKA